MDPVRNILGIRKDRCSKNIREFPTHGFAIIPRTDETIINKDTIIAGHKIRFVQRSSFMNNVIEARDAGNNIVGQGKNIEEATTRAKKHYKMFG